MSEAGSARRAVAAREVVTLSRRDCLWEMSRTRAFFLNCPLRRLLAVFLVAAMCCSAAAQTGSEVFASKCTACHTIGEGPKIGPDLKGVTERREQAWLKVQIQNPKMHHDQNDPVTQELRKTFPAAMPNLGISDQETDALIVFLGGGATGGAPPSGIPGPFIPTIGVGLVLIAGFTLIGLQAGKKKALEV